jgi:glycosyltransferase involved in cell wall biosynthesis
MLISIVTTSFNHYRYLMEALQSVRVQGGADVEHVVVDGVSTDGSVDVLRSLGADAWPHLRWLSERDEGQTQAMNKGIRMSRGEIIGWLNSDDRYRAGALEAVARMFLEHPEVDVLYGDYTFIDEHGQHLRDRREINFNPLVLFHHRVPHIPTTATFFRRRIFDHGEWLDESLQYAMDHELFVRLARRGYRFRHMHRLLADFRLHPSSKTCSQAALQLQEAQHVRERHTPLFRSLRQPLLRAGVMQGLSAAAAVSRYGSKLLQGCYMPDRLMRLSESKGGHG